MRMLWPIVLVVGCSDYKISSMEESPATGLADTGASSMDTGTPPSATDTGELSGAGSVAGRICDPAGTGWVAGARVWIDVDWDGDGVGDEVIETTTDAEGRFLLEGVPPGTWEVHVQKGSFTTSVMVEVTDGLVELADDECLGADLDIAVLRGSYDSTEDCS